MAARLSIHPRRAAQLFRHAVLSTLPLHLALAHAAEPPSPEDEVVLPAVTVTESATSAVEALGATDLQTPSGTASRLGLSLRETPAAAYIADRATIEARGANNTQEILAAIPGVTAHSAPGNPTVSFRGFGGGAVSQLFNGINTQYSIAARPVDSWIYDRVEAIGGASSFLYGAGGVGGTLNYITKLAEPTEFAEGQVRLGSHGGKQVSVGINRRLSDATADNAHYLRLDVNHSRGGSAVDGVKSASSQLAASLRSDLGGGLRHTLAYEVQHERVDRPYWGTPLRNPLGGEAQIDPATRHKNYNSADGLYAQNVQWLRSITEWQVDEHLRWSNTFYAYSALRDYHNVESYRFNADNSAVTRASALLQRHKQHLVGNRVEGQLQSTLGGQRSDWAWGLDVSVNRQTRYPNSLSGTISTVNPYDFATEDFFSIPGMQPGFHADRNNRITNVALYAENRTYLAPTLQIISALRHERIDLDLTNQRAITPTQPASYSRKYQPTTGRLGLVWEATPEVALYAQMATAADPPAGALASLSFADALNGTDLTTGRQVEVGSKWQGWDGKASATLAAYQIERKNIATQDPNNPSRTVLVGQQTSRGLEATAGIALSPRLALRGDASWVRARYDNFQQGGVSLAGKHPTNTPAVVANLWAFYQLSPQLQLSAGVRHIGKIYGDAANTLYWPSTTLLDLGLDYRIDRHTSLQARLRNATDRTYAASLSSGMAYLGAGRSASLALRVGF